MTGRPGKWPWKNHSVAVTPLMPDDPLRLGVVLDDPVDHQDRPAMRDERLDLAGRVDGGLGHGRLASGVGRR